MKFYLFIRQEKKSETRVDPGFNKSCNKLTPEIIHIWKKASIPTVSKGRIRIMIQNFHTNYRNILKSRGKQNSKLEENVSRIKTISKTLFDIASCYIEIIL